jgi:cytochrome c-type biogenesis protein CcmE
LQAELRRGENVVETEDPTVPKRKRPPSKNARWLIGGLILALAVGYLVFTAARGSAAYYLTIEELQQRGPSSRNVRVAGNTLGESIVWTPREQRLEFEIVDQSGRLPVIYSGSRPDMFRDQAEVVVEGKLGPDGVFEAHTMLLKCPSKYEQG